MNISRFFGATNREALRQVRMALGPDALIVSNKRINGGVEILATDQTSFAEEGPDAPAGSAPSVSAAPVARQAPVHRQPSVGPGTDVMGAIGELRGALESRIDELMWGNQLRRVPQAVSLFQTLLGFGFSTALLRAMLKRLPQDLSAKAAFQWARNELVTHLPMLNSEDDLWVPGAVVALVGPTGVGKTTTIAKLAARCVKRAGSESIVLLTTDTYRIGAHEQLKIYGQIMRVPVHVVQDAGELKRIVGGISPAQTILIDNVGISQRDRYISEQAAMLAQAGRKVNRILVLNASSHGDTLDEVARTYSNDGGTALRGCIITKLDEATRLGAALDTAIRYQLPISYVSNGQKVPENLLFLEASELVDQALVQHQQSQALYAPTEADFAALMSMAKAPADESVSAVAEARRQQLLPNLLLAISDSRAPLSMSDLKSVCTYIDENSVCSEAYDLWQGYTTPAAASSSLETSVNHLLRAAQNELGQAGHSHFLAVHDHISLVSSQQTAGRLRATVILTDRAAPLITPLQQLTFAGGWHSSTGDSDLTPPGAADALLQKIDWLGQHARNLPLIHLFEGATQTTLRTLLAQGVSWLAQSSATTKVEVQSCPTTLGAVAKTLDYRPVDQTAQLLQLSHVRGKPIGDVVLWVGSQVVELNARQVSPVPVQMISVRIVHRHDGSLIKSFYGLSNLFPTQMPPEVLAVWLVAQAEAKMGFRYAAHYWQLLGQSGQSESAQKKALAAMQMGLAAWHVMQTPEAHEARTIVRGLAGGKASLTAPVAASAVMKLFALKEMLA